MCMPHHEELTEPSLFEIYADDFDYINKLLKSGRENTKIKTETTAELEELQIKKEAIAEWLNYKIIGVSKEVIEEEEVKAFEESRKPFTVSSESVEKDGKEENNLYVINSRGEKVKTTLGNIVSGQVWDRCYNPDNSFSNTAAAKIYIEEAKNKINHLTDLQIAITQAEYYKTRDEHKYIAYKALVDRLKGGQEADSGGFAEKMAFSFLTQVAIDNNLPFEVESANPIEDVDGKIDFIIHVTDHQRAVEVETSLKKDVEDIGIQFTTRTDPGVIEKARRAREVQAKRVRKGESKVDDLVLMQVGLNALRPLIERWKREGVKIPGGPDQILDKKYKVQILRGALANIKGITENQIDNIVLQVLG